MQTRRRETVGANGDGPGGGGAQKSSLNGEDENKASSKELRKSPALRLCEGDFFVFLPRSIAERPRSGPALNGGGEWAIRRLRLATGLSHLGWPLAGMGRISNRHS